VAQSPEITDRRSLIAALRRAGIPDGAGYEIVGILPALITSDPFLSLGRRADRWVISDVERGSEDVRAEFGTEREAVQRFYADVVRQWDAVRHPVRRDPAAPRLSKAQLQAEVKRLQAEAAERNAAQEREFE
jgi:hypothetical protein